MQIVDCEVKRDVALSIDELVMHVNDGQPVEYGKVLMYVE